MHRWVFKMCTLIIERQRDKQKVSSRNVEAYDNMNNANKQKWNNNLKYITQ